MKIAVLSESPADETFVHLIASAILGRETEPLTELSIRSRGWPSVKNILPSILYGLHYSTDVDALIVVADSNGSNPHQIIHTAETAGDCRLCALRNGAESTLGRLRAVPGRNALRLAVGLAIPAIEAWYLCGRDATVTEAAWLNGRREARLPYSKLDLKTRAYGTDRPSLELETTIAEREGHRHAADLTSLRQSFPAGCGSMLTEIEAWRERG